MKLRKWEKALLEIEDLLAETKKEKKLRHNLPFVRASDIGTQCYFKNKGWN